MNYSLKKDTYSLKAGSIFEWVGDGEWRFEDKVNKYFAVAYKTQVENTEWFEPLPSPEHEELEPLNFKGSNLYEDPLTTSHICYDKINELVKAVNTLTKQLHALQEKI
jgi:hypothetical protein